MAYKDNFEKESRLPGNPEVVGMVNNQVNQNGASHDDRSIRRGQTDRRAPSTPPDNQDAAPGRHLKNLYNSVHNNIRRIYKKNRNDDRLPRLGLAVTKILAKQDYVLEAVREVLKMKGIDELEGLRRLQAPWFGFFRTSRLDELSLSVLLKLFEKHLDDDRLDQLIYQIIRREYRARGPKEHWPVPTGGTIIHMILSNKDYVLKTYRAFFSGTETNTTRQLREKGKVSLLNLCEDTDLVHSLLLKFVRESEAVS